MSEYENCHQKTLVLWLLKLIPLSDLLFEVPQTSPPWQRGAHLTVRSPCDPGTTPKPRSLRFAESTPNRLRQICTSWKIPFSSRVQLEEAVSCITKAYSWSTHLAVRDLVSCLSPLLGSVDTHFPAELQAGLENRSGEWSTSPTTALQE